MPPKKSTFTSDVVEEFIAHAVDSALERQAKEWKSAVPKS